MLFCLTVGCKVMQRKSKKSLSDVCKILNLSSVKTHSSGQSSFETVCLCMSSPAVIYRESYEGSFDKSNSRPKKFGWSSSPCHEILVIKKPSRIFLRVESCILLGMLVGIFLSFSISVCRL